MKSTSEETTHQVHARALLADIRSTPVSTFPRREAITDWLGAYLDRASQKGYVTDDAEANDLIELDRFLRTYQVPAVGESAA